MILLRKLQKDFFLKNYSYYFRFSNIKRKIKNLESYTNDLRKIIQEEYKPFIFKDAELRYKKQKLAGIKEFKITISDQTKIEDPKFPKLSFDSIPPSEQARYLLYLEIISETTQYCADLASVMISLKNYEKNKLSIIHIRDKAIRDWYTDEKIPSLNDFFKILDYPSLQKLPLEKRFDITIRYEKLYWTLKEIGKFYNEYYKYIYTPYRHNMKIFLLKSQKNEIFFFRLDDDGTYHGMNFPKEKILDRCEEITNLTYRIFTEYLEIILFGKILAPTVKNLGVELSKAPKMPIVHFEADNINKNLNIPTGLKIYHFLIDDIPTILKFFKSRHLDDNIFYQREKEGVDIIKIYKDSLYLDDFWAYTIYLGGLEYLILSSSPLSYSFELMYIKLNQNLILDNMLRLLIISFLYYVDEVKSLIILPKAGSPKLIQEMGRFNHISEKINKSLKYLFSFYFNKNFIIQYNFSSSEISFFIYIFERKFIPLLFRKTYTKRFLFNQIIEILINALIIHFFSKEHQIFKIISNFFQNDKLDLFLETSKNLIMNLINSYFNFEILFTFIYSLNCSYHISSLFERKK